MAKKNKLTKRQKKLIMYALADLEIAMSFMRTKTAKMKSLLEDEEKSNKRIAG